MFTQLGVVAIIQSVGLVALFLIAIGLGLTALTWWFWTTARPEPVSLAPLEIMSDRRYSRASEADRKQMIESARDLVKVSRTPRPIERPARKIESRSNSDSGKGKPVDPLLK